MENCCWISLKALSANCHRCDWMSPGVLELFNTYIYPVRWTPVIKILKSCITATVKSTQGFVDASTNRHIKLGGLSIEPWQSSHLATWSCSRKSMESTRGFTCSSMNRQIKLGGLKILKSSEKVPTSSQQSVQDTKDV